MFIGAVLGDLSADFLRESLGHSLATHMKSYRDFYLGKEKKQDLKKLEGNYH